MSIKWYYTLYHTGEGEPIINSALYSLSTESPTRRLKKEIPNKIGTRPEKYEILGNNKKYDIKWDYLSI